MASIAAFVYFWSSAYEVSGCCTTDTLYPSFLRMLATASQPEPSAKAPCTRTTFLVCCFTIILLCNKDSLSTYSPTELRSVGVEGRTWKAPLRCDDAGVVNSKRSHAGTRITVAIKSREVQRPGANPSSATDRVTRPLIEVGAPRAGER